MRWLFITHRGGISPQIQSIQNRLGCELIIQEQEAYLLPELLVKSFENQLTLNDKSYVFWTPGHSPGSACLYWNQKGGVLFSGRHLLPNQQGQITPIYTDKTFHWQRQLRSVSKIRENFNRETLSYICPGANTGFLRKQAIIDCAYDKLRQLDLKAILLCRS